MSERSTSQPVGLGGVDTFLGKGTKINGKVVLEGSARLEGQIEGEISAQEALTIGESAVINAKIAGTSIIVEGRINGDVTARQRLELRASSRVQGNVTTASLIVHQGAVLEGKCAMSGAEAAARRDRPDVVVGPVAAERPPSQPNPPNQPNGIHPPLGTVVVR